VEVPMVLRTLDMELSVIPPEMVVEVAPEMVVEVARWLSKDEKLETLR
jgi:hypothetical protein